MRLKQLEIYEWSRKKARDLEFEGQRTTLWYDGISILPILLLWFLVSINNMKKTPS